MKRTPLFDIHHALGARFTEFAGWEMPVQYTSIREEHQAVRQRAGLFDVSHMGRFELTGAGLLITVNQLVTSDLRRLSEGQCYVTLICNEAGGILDDLMVMSAGPERCLLVVNAANRETDLAWIQEHLKDTSAGEISDRSDETFCLALQGPQAEGIAQSLCYGDVTTLRRRHWRQTSLADLSVTISRTGYTGEDGFEIIGPAEGAAELWQALLKTGKDRGLKPAGLGARDLLRLEAGLRLYGTDMDAETTPLEAGLESKVDWNKGDFIGRDALLRQKTEGVRRRWVGFVMEEERAIPRYGYPILVGDHEVGRVTSGTHSLSLNRGIGAGYVPPEQAQVGTSLEIEIRGRRYLARVVALPFVRGSAWQR